MARLLEPNGAAAGATHAASSDFLTALDLVAQKMIAAERERSRPGLAIVLAVRRWHQRRRTIRTLLELDDHRLKDIGLTRSTILAAFRDQKEAMRRGWF
jgi:uncharacterized protein YjiS (DUF1127 family)